MRRFSTLLFLCLLGFVSGFVGGFAEERQEPSLAQLCADYFPIGMGIGPADLRDPAVWALVRHHCQQVTIENALKPSPTQRQPGVFDFTQAEALIAAAEEAGLGVHAHTLVWHRQTPDWFFVDEAGEPFSSELARSRLRQHIQGVAGHFRGRVQAWDVVNEALVDGPGEDDFRPSPWYQAMGEEYIIKAFRLAAEADPEALLYYNDYGLETEPKRSRAVRLIKRLQEAGVRVDGIGIQAHLQVDGPPIAEIERSIVAFAELGLRVHISELDVSVLPWRQPGSDLLPEDQIFSDGLSEEMAAKQRQRYRELFALFLRHHEVISGVTMWNTHDGRSWLNYFPVQDRVDHPLLFDRELQPKAAFAGVLQALE
ncbi:MAG: endo-1,4-beta-xylanase, partial [Planctomycetota bacterium]